MTMIKLGDSMSEVGGRGEGSIAGWKREKVRGTLQSGSSDKVGS